MRLLLALFLVLCPLAVAAQQAPPTGEQFIKDRIGGDAMTIAQLLDRIAALQAQIDKRKAEDAKDGKEPKP